MERGDILQTTHKFYAAEALSACTFNTSTRHVLI